MRRSLSLCATLAALSLLPALTPQPVRAQQALSPALIAPDLALAEAIARRPLSVQERAQVTAIDEAQFRHDPAWSLKTLRQEAVDLQNVRRMDPVRLADWRKAQLVGNYFYVGPLATPEETKMLVAIYTRTNPIIVADTTSKTVICERDIDAWVAASQMMAQKCGTPVSRDLRAELIGYARSEKWGGQTRIIAANMEREWTAYQLGWAHEPLSDQRAEMRYKKEAISAGLPQSPLPPLGNTRSVALSALAVAHFVYGDYPYCLRPKFAAEKGPMMLAIMQAGRRRVETLHALNGYVPGNP